MKLSASQRSDLFAGLVPKITFPGASPCPVKVGHVEVLSPHVRIEVTEIRRSKKGDWVIVYALFNNRLGQRFLAAQDGQIHPENYTHSGGSAIDHEAGEAVDEFTQRQITRQARLRHQQNVEVELGGLLAAMRELRGAIDEMPEDRKRRMSRSLWQLRARLDSAEREMRRRLAA
jgi:hypothetical protein